MNKEDKPLESSTNTSGITIGIYQNSDHIAGLLQQLFAAPLVTGESRESARDEAADTTKQIQGRAKGAADARLALVGKLGLGLAGDAEWLKKEGLATGTKTTQNFTYSQAYYLFFCLPRTRRKRTFTHCKICFGCKETGAGRFCRVPGDISSKCTSFSPRYSHS